MSCSICDKIPRSSAASATSALPDAASALKRSRQQAYEIGSSVDLWQCPECGFCYLHTLHVGLDEYMYGTNGEETLDRLTREQSDVVHAISTCQADPAAIEEPFFALPPIAFGESLHAAYATDRDFVALFIPRLVHAFAARSHATHDVLYALVEDKPSYARDVLAAATSLPPELREKLGDLEQRCRDAT